MPARPYLGFQGFRSGQFESINFACSCLVRFESMNLHVPVWSGLDMNGTMDMNGMEL